MLISTVGSLRLDEDQFFRAGGNAENARMPDEFGGTSFVSQSIVPD